MKIYISSDQEGVSGIATRSNDAKDVNENKRLQTEEIIACCNAIIEFDQEAEIVINDSHSKGLNLDFESLPERVELIRQSPEILDQMYGIDDSYDGFMFYAHSMRGTLGALLSHVWEVHDLIVNGKRLGEAGIASYIASYYNVPFIFSAGDDHYAAEVKDLSPTTETAVVKYGMGRYVARNIHPKMARKIIADGTKRALRRLKAGEIKPVVLPDPPYKLQMNFDTTGQADAACMMPGVDRQDGWSTLYVTDDMKELYKAFYCQTRLQRGRLI